MENELVKLICFVLARAADVQFPSRLLQRSTPHRALAMQRRLNCSSSSSSSSAAVICFVASATSGSPGASPIREKWTKYLLHFRNCFRPSAPRNQVARLVSSSSSARAMSPRAYPHDMPFPFQPLPPNLPSFSLSLCKFTCDPPSLQTAAAPECPTETLMLPAPSFNPSAAAFLPVAGLYLHLYASKTRVALLTWSMGTRRHLPPPYPAVLLPPPTSQQARLLSSSEW